MPYYHDSNQLLEMMQAVFSQVARDNPQATNVLSDSKLILRLKISDPALDVTFNGRKKPPEITYGKTPLRPDLDVSLSADSLHAIMLGDLPLGSALGSGKMKVQGNVIKSFVMKDIFQQAQRVYPELWNTNGKARQNG